MQISNTIELVDAAERYGLPTMYPTRTYVARGGLLAYEPRITDLARVDEIIE